MKCICTQCGKTFSKPPRMIKKSIRHFCNKECQKKYYQEHTEIFKDKGKYDNTLNKLKKIRQKAIE